MRSNRGFSLIGFIFIAAILAALGVIVFRAVPMYNEFIAVKRIINSLDVSGANVTPLWVRREFDSLASADYVYNVKPEDIRVSKEDGKVIVSVEYQRTIPLFANVSLLFEFETSNRK